MFTQRLALRRNVFQRQTLTTLHDRTSSWLGLGAGLNAVRRKRTFSAPVLLTVLYLGCLFGLHNTIPALPVIQGAREHLANDTVKISPVTPRVNTSMCASSRPYPE
jgi:hypothetical protein